MLLPYLVSATTKNVTGVSKGGYLPSCSKIIVVLELGLGRVLTLAKKFDRFLIERSKVLEFSDFYSDDARFILVTGKKSLNYGMYML